MNIINRYCRKCGSKLIYVKTERYTAEELSSSKYDAETGKEVIAFITDMFKCPNKKSFMDGHDTYNENSRVLK
jgi:ribosomal protein L33